MGEAPSESVFEIDGDERDTLVRHALGVIFAAGDSMMHHTDGETVKPLAQHIGVMVHLLDQLGWSLERPHDGSYTLRDDLLPIEQVRVWVETRFRVDDEEAVADSVYCLREDLDSALQNFGQTSRLLHRLNARAESLGRRVKKWTRAEAAAALVGSPA